MFRSRLRQLLPGCLLLAIVPAMAGLAHAADPPYVKLTFYSGNDGTGKELVKIGSDDTGPLFDAPAGLRSVRLTRVTRGEVFRLFVNPDRKKRIDPLHPANEPGADAWVSLTALRDVTDELVGSFETTYSDDAVRVEYNGPGPVDGRVTKIELGGKIADPNALQFVLAGDLHVDFQKVSGGPDICENCQANRSLVKALNGLSQFQDPAGKSLGTVDFALLAGDILDMPSFDQRDKFEQIYKSLSIPYHLTSGNHDVPRSHFYDDYLDASIKAQHGGLYFYSFNLNGVHFVQQHTNCPDQCVKGHNWDELQQSLDFLRSDLAHVGAGVPIVIFQHYGFDSDSVGWWPVKYQQQFFEILKGRNFVGLLSGHSHVLGSRAIPGYPLYYNFTAGTCDTRPGRGGSNQFWLFDRTQDQLRGRVVEWDYQTGALSWPTPGTEVTRPLSSRRFWSVSRTAGDETNDPPAFVEVQGTRYRVWSSSKDNKIFYSTLDKATGIWSTRHQVAPDSAHARSWEVPAVAFYENRLNVLWHKLNTDRMYISALDGTTWTPPVEVRGPHRPIYIGKDKSPAMVVSGNTLYVVYNGYGDARLWYTTAINAFQFADDQAITDSYTDNHPALTLFGGKPYVAWAKHLGDRAIYIQSFANNAWSQPTAILDSGATSDRAPGLAAFDGKLYLAWSDTKMIYYSWQENGVWQPKAQVPIPRVVSHRGTTLGVLGDHLYLGWNRDYQAYFASLSK